MMTEPLSEPFTVEFRQLHTLRVACIVYHGPTDPRNKLIGVEACFQRIKDWIKANSGYDASKRLTVGMMLTGDEQLSDYRCCVHIPTEIQAGSSEVEIKEIPGGSYAILRVDKEPHLISQVIERFHKEYVPENQLEIEIKRPTYEIYFEKTMVYCTPVREPKS